MSEFEMEKSQEITLQDALKVLKTYDGDMPDKTILYGLSGLMSADVKLLKPVWETLANTHRRKIIRTLVETSEADFEMDYRTVGLFALDDLDSNVREAAIEVLWEDQSLEVMNRLIELTLNDADKSVRAAASTALGRYILLGELGDLPEGETIRAQDAMIRILKSDTEDISVKRRALEAIANCSHDIVPRAIHEAYHSDQHALQVSSLFAMGRSCDEKWSDIIIEELDSSDPEMRYEAVRASGELALGEAVRKLAKIAVEEDDREVKEVAIWSLGEAGGKEALRVLNLLLETAEDEDDDDLIQAIEDAIGNASLAQGDLFMFDVSQTDFIDEDDMEDLDD